MGRPVDAVIFDLDGVLVQSEEVWDAARRALASEAGIEWPAGATEAMMGMSSPEWAGYVRDEIGVQKPPETISAEVVRQVEARYRSDPPWIDGALDAVARMAARWPLGLATSSNREIIDLVLELGALGDVFAVTVSSEEVGGRGKPAPDVYLEAARRLAVEPSRCAAVEDSTNGLLSADAAGMLVVAIPNEAHPPAPAGLDVAEIVLDSIADLRPESISAS